MAGDGGFERDMVNGINEAMKNEPLFAFRFKQHRFSGQKLDVAVDSNRRKYFSGIECKSKQIEVKKAEKDNNQTEAKLYFSQAFNKNEEGVSQVTRITDFLQKTGRRGYLAIAYRRGRGKKVHYYSLPWKHVEKLFEKENCNGITREYVRKHGTLLHNADSIEEFNGMKRSEKRPRFDKIFDY